MFVHAVFVWLLLAALAVANGLARQAMVAPRVGELVTHWIGTATALVLFFTAMMLTIGGMAPPRVSTCGRSARCGWR